MEHDRTHEPEKLDSPALIDLGSALVETKGPLGGIFHEFSQFQWRF